MKLTDILALTKAGYSVSEIKSMENRDSVVELVTNGVARDDVQDYLELMQAEPVQEPEQEPEKDPEPDWKAKYEELQKAQQKAATQKAGAAAPPKTAEQILSELLSE